MRKTTFSVLTLMFICFAFISSAFSSSESTIFNSDFEIKKKQIHFSHRVFRLDKKGKGIITITSNVPHKKITNGFVILNKKRIKLKKGFKKNGLVLEKKIKLRKKNRLAVFIKGKRGASINVTITKRGISPSLPEVTFAAEPSVIEMGQTSTLTWSSTNKTSAFMDNGIGSVPVNGSVIVYPSKTASFTLTVIGPTGSASASSVVQVTGNPTPQPAGSYGKQHEDQVPPDATVQSYDEKRFAIITGEVQAQNATPLAGASITIHGHPEYGTAFTDATGRFSIPVEGGGILTVEYKKAGLLTAHRKVYVSWNDTAIAKTIQMIPQDPVATAVVFDGNPDTIVTHQSSEVSDEFGSRSFSMVFTGDNRAFLVGEDGNDIQELTAITTRVTEFETPETMPAILPPNSAYTYCVELAVDGIERVRFEKPIITYINNFLGFETGGIVPVGYFDRDKGVWVPSDNGVVVKLLDTDTDGIVDALDADGDNLPDDLNASGSFADEVTGLDNLEKYVPDTTFWRVAVSHFSPWDINWPFALPIDAIVPNANAEPILDAPKTTGATSPPSNIECMNSYVKQRSRIFHEDIPVPGTNINLHYAGNRVKGYKEKIFIPISGDTVPASLKRIIVKIEVAGRTIEHIFDPLPNQNMEYIWDGLDHLGRQVIGQTNAHVNVGFVYDAVYTRPGNFARSFAQAGREVTGIVARQEMISWKSNAFRLINDISVIAEGWSLSSHHYIRPMDISILHKGDGALSHNNASIITTAAGNGIEGFSGDGGIATEAALKRPHYVTVDAAGNLYIADFGNDRIRKVDTTGVITTIAGSEAGFDQPRGMAFDTAGNLYIADVLNNRIRKMDTAGVITTVAGNGAPGYSGDGGPATEAALNQPHYVALDTGGNLFIADFRNHRIRKVDPTGIISTVAGNGSQGYSGDRGLATEAMISGPVGVSVDSAGNLYFVGHYNHCIRKVDTAGIITTVAGNGYQGYSGDGGPAIEAMLSNPASITVDSSGNFYIADFFNDRVRKVDTTGVITTIAGNGASWYTGDGGPAIDTGIQRPTDVAVDAAGNIYIGNPYDNRIRKVAIPIVFARFGSAGNINFAEDNGLGYILSGSGLHLKTINLETGIVLQKFGYNQNNKLISITDQFGNQTEIQYAANELPMSITSPDGLTTTLDIDADNHLTRITYPDGNFFSFAYTSDGLMTAETEPNGNRFEHIFDTTGRLVDVFDEEGGNWHYEKTASNNGEILTEMVTAEGNLTSYQDHTFSTGAYASIITYPTGAETLFTQSADGLTVHNSLSCGMDLEFSYDVDPEYKFKYVKEVIEKTPAKLEKITQKEIVYADTDADEVSDLITRTVIVNRRKTTIVHNVLQSKKTIKSPGGRTVTSVYNPETLRTEIIRVPGLNDTEFGYDNQGRSTWVKTGTRETVFKYNSSGFLDSVTDPENHTVFYIYDAVGRMTGIKRPDESSIGFTYDLNGNMTVLTNPVDVGHGFEFDSVNLNSSYQAPLSGSYSYLYDKDRRLIQTSFPSGKNIVNDYADPLDSTDKSRLWQIRTPEVNIDFTYLCGTKVESITNGTDTITYGYDGALVTSEALSGTLNQILTYTYNNDFNVQSFTYAGGTANYTYDNDNLLTGARAFMITRYVQNGLLEAVTDGSLSLTRIFNGYGEVSAQDYIVNDQSLISWNLVRDDTGRIIQKTETLGDSTNNYEYTHDLLGRLLTVKKDDVLVEQYEYSLNGARIYVKSTLRNIEERTATYSDEEHLLTSGSSEYEYDADGFLNTKIEGTDKKTTYVFSSRGELLQVTLPEGKIIEYVHDPMGRRIAKKVNDTIVEKYLWQGLTRLLAVYDGNDNLLMRFEYADGRMPIAMAMEDTTYYLTYDQVGSLRAVADSFGSVVKRIDYDSFGNIIGDTDPAFEVPFGFAGGLHDRDTGLVRFGYRDYDPDIGRWTAKDPTFFAGGDTDIYGYVLNDPTNFSDPLGLWGIGIGGSSVGIDFSTTIYDSGQGWFPSTITDIDVSTTLVGGGIKITFDTPIESYSTPDRYLNVSLGILSKYLGITYNTELSRGSLNIGAGLGIPITFGTSIQNFIEGLGNLFQREGSTINRVNNTSSSPCE